MQKEVKKRWMQVGIWGLGIVVPHILAANITGTVYKDFNFNGTQDGGDAPVIGASIKATCEDGNVATAITDANGAYVLSGFTSGSKCRIEAYVSSAGIGSGPNATGSAAPLVDVVADGSVHNISTGSPATYCQANPDVVMATLPGYFNGESGRQSPDGYGSIFKVPTPDIGSFNERSTIAAKRTEIALSDYTGAIWGMAWKKGTKELFAAANLKRYAPLKGEPNNANPGAIYKIDMQNSNVVSLFATVANAVSDDVKNNIIPHRNYDNNKDTTITPYVGRQGLGDIDINEEETKLYVVNMYTKSLVILDANSGVLLNTVAIPNPYGATCPDEDVRPWALKARGSDVFIGSVCESKVADGVGAAIQKYNGAIFQTIAETNALTYLRARGYRPKGRDAGDGYRYRNWSASGYSDAPILTDIEFTNNGDLVLGYNSQATYNRSGSLRGDVRKMCLNADGTYTDESTDVVSTTCVSHQLNYADNPTDYFEFYTGDFFGSNHGESGHPETASGALAQAPGAPNIIVGMIDGTNWWQPGAIGLYSNTTGDKIGAQAVIDNNKVADGGEREVYGFKAGGMGDVELLCDPAPVEIGNLVWVDGNQDGIQDANEPGIPNVSVSLTCDGATMGTAVTDTNGHYYFGGINNTNLLAGKTITAGKSCVLSLAKADVNNKPPTVTDPNADANDTIDNDAVENGTNNEITFTTTVSNNHSLDFGITPTLGCVEGLLYDDANNDSTHQTVEQVASNVDLTITDSFGGVHSVTTDSAGNYQLTGIPAGAATVKVDVTDTDIPEGSIWYNSTFSVNIPESTPAGVPATCLVQDARLHIPAPLDQDPKDSAVCANPTSLTWEGATVSSASVWHDMGSNYDASTSKIFTTVGGATVNAMMYIADPDAELNNASSGTYNGSATAGTDGAFNDPYLTLYLGDQTSPGDGNWSNGDGQGCSAHGYDLVTGEKIELNVEFSDEVVLDNWRIRDVDSGDDRSGTANWNWQDGIEVKAFDANNNPVEIETKIGSAGAGLIKDANDIVHTDPATYNGGNVATGTGTTPNSSNGHIVLTSNFVPIKRLVVTHVAGPDVPCQTRSALAMAGLAVCKPLHIAGTVYNDPDGSKPTSACATSSQAIDGTPINSVEGQMLHACLVDNANKIIDAKALDANGAYDFDTFIHPNESYKVIITTSTCTVGNDAPSATLPTDWIYEGEVSDATAIPVALDSVVDGKVDVNVATSDITGIDFGINKRPTASGYSRPSVLNPGGSVEVDFDETGAVPHNYITDNEENTPSKIMITQAPSSAGTIKYNGTPVNNGDVIDNPDFANFTIDPADGEVSLGFTYVSIDAACRESSEAVFTAAFAVPQIAGTLYLDLARNDTVDGTATPNSCDATTPLYANLVDANTNLVLSSIALDNDGSYTFKYDDGVRPNTDYEIVLSQTGASNGDTPPSSDLPSGCMHADGENINSQSPAGTDGNADGKVLVSVVETDVVGIDFSITPSVKIGDKVWIEDDNDGDATTGTIMPVAGTTVTATCGQLAYTATTDSNGIYSIEVPINIGECTIVVPTPNGKTPSAGSNDNSVSDNTSENDKTHDGAGTTVTIATTDNLTLDFGFTSVGALCGHVSEDTNNDNTGDTAISGVTLTLFDASGTQVGATVDTNASGDYCFNNLTPGDYTVKETQPSGYLDVSENEGGADNDKADNGELNAIAATVDAGETDTHNDFVEEKPGSLCGNVTEDTNNDDTGDLAIPGVTLTLFDVNGMQVGIGMQTTDAEGNYCFTELAPGIYTVEETQPEGYVDVSENEGGDDNDRTDNNRTNAITAIVDPDEIDIGNDFVEEDAQAAYRVGDLFWIDDNNNGIYDEGEEVIGGATVELLDENGNVIKTTVTDEAGRYHFDVPAGKYKVRFHIPQDKLDEGFVFVSVRHAGDDTNKVLSSGVVEHSIEVGPNLAHENLTLDAAISCGCADVASDSGDALSVAGMLSMLLLMLSGGLLFVRREMREEV